MTNPSLWIWYDIKASDVKDMMFSKTNKSLKNMLIWFMCAEGNKAKI